MAGWIKLHRKIRESWVVKDPENFAVWIHLLLDANHSKKTKFFNGQNITIERGQLVFGRKAYSQKTGVSEAKIRAFLNNLVNDQAITVRTTSRYSIITVLSYNSYQLNDQPSTVPTTTLEEVKKIRSKEVKKESENKFSDADLELAGVIFYRVLIAAPKTKPPNLDSWANTVRLMRERDGYTHEEIEQVFLYANHDSFWKSQILSVSNLRKKFASLHSQMSNGENKNANSNGNRRQSRGEYFDEQQRAYERRVQAAGIGDEPRVGEAH